MRISLLSGSALALVSILGCSSGDVSGSRTGTDTASIINGSPDTEHQAVVAVLGSMSLCSGTIIHTDPGTGIGHVLTAAHCVSAGSPPVEIREGNNINSPGRVYSVVSYSAHPAYNQNNASYDFGVIRFAGADAQTPVIPMASSGDGLSGSATVESVGYGRTSRPSQGQNNNSVRNTVDLQIVQLGGTQIITDISARGICSGDSGGPVLFPAGQSSANQRVVGVHSAVTTAECDRYGYNGRVQAVADAFITPYINGDVVETCDLCQQTQSSGGGTCVAAVTNCNGDQECLDFIDCAQGCNSDQTCTNDCVDQHPSGVRVYVEILDCLCDACPVQCADDAYCTGRPACGFGFSDDTCGGCNDSSCCSQASACADDPDCSTCATSQNPPGTCSNDALYTSFIQCLSDSCDTECGFNSGTGGAGGAGGAGQGGAAGAGATGGAGTGGSEGGTGGGASSSGGSAQGGSSSGATTGAGANGGSATGGAGTAGAGGANNDQQGRIVDSGSDSSCAVAPAPRSRGLGFGALFLLGLVGLRRRRVAPRR